MSAYREEVSDMKIGKVRFEENRGWFQDAASHDEIHERFHYPAFIIKKFVQEAISLPSNLCFDAPLVAVGWAVLIGVETRGDLPPLYIIGGLFLAVWGIYLFDRIFDSFRLPIIEATPRRHLFAKKYRFILYFLSGVTVFAGATFILPHVTADLFKVAFAPGLLCLLYFVIFRFARQSGGLRIPAKELVIGFCFASGVMVAAGTHYTEFSSWVLGLALAFLFAGHCLVIGSAEQEFDSEMDAASFFGNRGTRDWIPIFLLSGVLLLALILALWYSVPFVGASLIIGSLLQFICFKRAGTDLMQPLADAGLLFPWLLLLFFG